MYKTKYYISDIRDGNIALHIWDNESKVMENRKNLSSKLNHDLEDFVYMNQIHGAKVQIVWKKNQKCDCDSIITNKKGIVLSVMVADCVPVLLYDNKRWIIWAVHAGWKWTHKKILENTIQKMLNIWANIDTIKVIIWPSIAQWSYEVWKEVADNFRTEVKQKKATEKFLLDLKTENKLQALELWVKEGNIQVIDIDTFSDKNYFSARRDGFSGWRFWWFIWLE